MLDDNLKAQLKAYLERLQRPVELVATLDDSATSNELRELLEDIRAQSDKITVVEKNDLDVRKPSFLITNPGTDSGVRFAVFVPGASDALVRGGRYDEVGAVFGRRRPAVGFSLDLKIVAELMAAKEGVSVRSAVRAPWGEDAALRQAVRQLRQQGQTVVCVLPGHEHEVQEFDCDRELSLIDGQWVVRSL